MARPKNKDELMAGLSDQARWLQGLQAQENNFSFNNMLGAVQQNLDSKSGGGYSDFTTAYRDSGVTGTASDAANQVWNFIQSHGKDAWRTAYNELANFNNGVAKWDFYEKNMQGKYGIAEPNPISRNALDFFTSAGPQHEFEKRLNEINSMKSAYLAGQARSLGDDFARQERRMLETHRRYGITGAAAQANLEDLQLKKSQALADLQTKTAAELDQRFRSETLQLNQMVNKEKDSARLGVFKQIAAGNIKSIEALNQALSQAGIKDTLSDEDKASLLAHPDAAQAHLKTII